MRHRTAQSSLIATAGLMGCASVGLLVWPTLSPPSRMPLNLPRTSEKSEAFGNPPAAPLSRMAFAGLSDLYLRRPLHDLPGPPPSPTTPPTASIPPLAIRLTGTIFEPGHCRAAIQLPDGRLQLIGVGQSAGDARILSIENGKVRIDYFGQSMVLTVPEENHQ